MTTPPTNHSNKTNIIPPNAPKPKNEGLECSKETFKRQEIPIPVKLESYSFRRLCGLKDSCMQFISYIFNRSSNTPIRMDKMQHKINLVKDAHCNQILFVNIQNGRPHLQSHNFEACVLTKIKEANQPFIIFNSRDKKILIPESLRHIDLSRATSSHTNEGHKAKLDDLLNDLDSYEMIHFSNEEWSELIDYAEANLADAKSEASEIDSKENIGVREHKRLTTPRSNVLNTQANRENIRSSQTIEKSVDFRGKKEELLRQELHIENDRNRIHREKRLENERIKTNNDIRKQEKRSEIAKEDRDFRDSKLSED